MSVVGIALDRPDSPTASFEEAKYTITRVVRVETDSHLDGPIVVTAAVGVPRLFQTYAFGAESQALCRCRTISAERIQPNSLFWDVTAVYTTPEPKERGLAGGNSTAGTGNETEGQFNNPLIELPEVSTHFETTQIPITSIFDVTSGAIAPIKASNGEIFVPPPHKDSSRLVLTITRNEDITSPHPATGLLYQDTCNSDTFWGCSAGQCKVQGITPTRATKQLPDGTTLPYLKVTYVLHFKSPDWDTMVLDSGTFYLDDQGEPVKEVHVAFKTSDGQPCQGLLDGTGHKLADGAAPVFIRVRPYNRLPFAALNLPGSFLEVQ